MWGRGFEKLKLVFGGAGFAGAVDGDVHAGDFSAFGKIPEFGGVKVGGWVGIADFSAGLAVKMNVLVEVGAVATLTSL
jgi:hypothetical protein